METVSLLKGQITGATVSVKIKKMKKTTTKKKNGWSQWQDFLLHVFLLLKIFDSRYVG